MRGANPHSHAELTLCYLVFCALSKLRQLEHRLRARCDVELRPYVCNVVFDRAFGSMQSVRDRRVRQALAQQLGDLALAPRETERIGASADVRPAPKSKRAELAQAAARYVGRGPGTERFEAIERGAQCSFVAAEQGERLLVHAAEFGPGIRRFLPLALDFESIRPNSTPPNYATVITCSGPILPLKILKYSGLAMCN